MMIQIATVFLPVCQQLVGCSQRSIAIYICHQPAEVRSTATLQVFSDNIVISTCICYYKAKMNAK